MQVFATTPSTESPPQSSSTLATPTTPTTPLTKNFKNNDNDTTTTTIPPPSSLSPYSQHYTTLTDPYHPNLYPSLHSHLTCRRSTTDSIAIAKNRFLSLLSSPHLPERPTFLICLSDDTADYRRILTCHGLDYIPSRVLTPTTAWDETCVAFVGDDALLPPTITFLPEWLVATRDSRFVSVPTLESFEEFVATGGLRNVGDGGTGENESPTASSHGNPPFSKQLHHFPSISSLNSSDHSGTMSSNQPPSSTTKRPSLTPHSSRVSKSSADRRLQVEDLVLRACPDEIDNIDEMVKQYGGKWDKLVYALRVMAGESPSSSARSLSSDRTRTPAGSNRSLGVEEEDVGKKMESTDGKGGRKDGSSKGDATKGMQFEWITVTKACVVPRCLLPTLFALEWGDDDDCDDDDGETPAASSRRLKGVPPLAAWFALRDRAEELNVAEHLDFLWKWLRAVCWRGTTTNDGGSAIVMSDSEVGVIGESEDEEDWEFLMNKRRMLATELLTGGTTTIKGVRRSTAEEEKEVKETKGHDFAEEKKDEGDGFFKIGESPKDDPRITLTLDPTLHPHLSSILKRHVKLVIRKPSKEKNEDDNDDDGATNVVVRLSPGSSPLLSNVLKTNVKIVVRRRNKKDKISPRTHYFNDGKVGVTPVAAAAVTSLEQNETKVTAERAIPPPARAPETTGDVITDRDASQNNTFSTNNTTPSSNTTEADDTTTNDDQELTPSSPAQESYDERLSTVLEADVEESMDMDDPRRSEVKLAAAAAVAAVARRDKESRSASSSDDEEKDENETEDDNHDDHDDHSDDSINATITTNTLSDDDDDDDIASRYLREQIARREKYQQSVNNVERALEKGDWDALLNIVGMDPDDLASSTTSGVGGEGRVGTESVSTDAELRGILESEGISLRSLLPSESDHS